MLRREVEGAGTVSSHGMGLGAWVDSDASELVMCRPVIFWGGRRGIPAKTMGAKLSTAWIHFPSAC